MKLEILICTMSPRLECIPSMLLTERPDVCYLVSCQYDDKQPKVPALLRDRDDVKLVFLQGRGLSHNRNNAMRHATNEILLIADDDECFDSDGLTQILRTYTNNPEVDIALFKVDGVSKYYPEKRFRFRQKDFKGAYYTASWEMSMRRTSVSSISFNPNFGLGSDYLASGEEQVYICDALNGGLRVDWFPITIATTSPDTTGEHFLTNIRVQRSKGATFYFLFGYLEALIMCTKEALHHFVYKRINPLMLMRNMIDGINYARTIKR